MRVRTRKHAVVVALMAATALASAGGTVALAKGDGPQGWTGSVNHQIVHQRTGSVGVSDTEWRTLPTRGRMDRLTVGPLSDIRQKIPNLPVVSRGPMTITVSLDVVGGPVEVRVIDDGRPLKPSKARFAPGPGDTSRSFTFVTPGSRLLTCHDLTVQWRSVDGSEVRSRTGSLSVLHDRPETVGFNCL